MLVPTYDLPMLPMLRLCAGELWVLRDLGGATSAIERSSALRSSVLSLANIISIGLRSGLAMTMDFGFFRTSRADRACTRWLDQGDTWTHVHGAQRGHLLALLRPSCA